MVLRAPPAVVLLFGDPRVAAAWQRALESSYRPAVMVFNLADVTAVPGICRGTTCLPPIADLAEVERALAVDSRDDGLPQS